MHSYKRADRVSSLIKEEISDIILNEVNDPRIDKLCTTVMGVEISDDLRNANIKISVRGDEEKSQKVMKGLESAKGYIRREIGNRINLRIVPEIRFELDHSIDYIIEVNELLREVEEDLNHHDKNTEEQNK